MSVLGSIYSHLAKSPVLYRLHDCIFSLYIDKVCSQYTRGLSFANTFHINCADRPVGPDEIDLVSVAFNNEQVIDQQSRLLRKYLLDPFCYTVADNSSDPEKRRKVREQYLQVKKTDFRPVFSYRHFYDTGARNWRSIYSQINRDEIAAPRFETGRLREGEIRQSDTYEIIGDWIHTLNASNWMTVRQLLYNDVLCYNTRLRGDNHVK
jgi:hypothetical protein